MVASAIVLAFLSFIVTNEVASGVLIYISEALVYAASIFGIGLYFRSQLGEFRNRAKDEIDKEVEFLKKELNSFSINIYYTNLIT